MRRTIIYTACFLFLCLSPLAMAKSREAVNPFNLVVGKSSYEDTVKEAKSRNWQYQEYEKKHFKPIGRTPHAARTRLSKRYPNGWKESGAFFCFLVWTRPLMH